MAKRRSKGKRKGEPRKVPAGRRIEQVKKRLQEILVNLNEPLGISDERLADLNKDLVSWAERLGSSTQEIERGVGGLESWLEEIERGVGDLESQTRKVVALKQETKRLKQKRERLEEELLNQMKRPDCTFEEPFKTMFYTPVKDPDALVFEIPLEPLTSSELLSLKRRFVRVFSRRLEFKQFNLKAESLSYTPDGESDSFAHKVAYTLPLLGHDMVFSQPGLMSPKWSRHETSKEFFRSVVPQFSRISNEEIYTHFNLLQTFMKNSINENNFTDHWESIIQYLGINNSFISRSSAMGILSLVCDVLENCVKMLPVTGLIVELGLQEECPNPATKKKDLSFASMVKYEDVPLLVVETRHTGLHTFVDAETCELKKDDNKFRSILQQCCIRMCATGLHHIILSDFTTTILIVVNMTEAQANQPAGQNFEGCFEFRVISASDPSISFPAVINTVLVFELASLTSKNSSYDKLPEAFRAWCVEDLVKQHITKFNEKKRIAKKCLENIILPEEERKKVADTAMLTGLKTLEALKTVPAVNELVDVETFESLSVVHWKQEDPLDVIQYRARRVSEVFGFTFNDNWNFKDSSYVPPRGTKLILKVYNPLNPDYKDPPLMSYFVSEIIALNAIQKHNKQSDEPIGLPDIYEYGRLRFHWKDGVIIYGFYILMSYVEDEEELMNAEEVKIANEKIDRDLALLESIGIRHRSAARRNKRINRAHPMLIDYSSSRTKLKEAPSPQG